MIRIAVVDDEEEERQNLTQAFLRLASQLREEVDIVCFTSGDDLLSNYDFSCDMICMDIDMPGRDGLTAARALRKLDHRVVLVFVTNMAQLAIQGYEVRATDFLIKPVDSYALALKMRSIFAMINSRKKRAILFSTADGMCRVSTDEVYYVEVNGHYLSFYTVQGKFTQKAALREWEEKLEGLSFKRCNNCYLVNLKHVAAVNRDELKVGDQWLKMSRPRKKQFLQALTNYMGGVSL